MDGYANIQGKNFAPVEPLKNLKKSGKDAKDNPSSFSAFLREQGEEIIREYEDEWRDQIEQARIIQNLRSGKLVMKADMGNTGYVFLKRLGNHASPLNRSNFPLFPSNSEALKAKWLKSNPLVRVSNFGDGYRTQIAQDDINTVAKYYFKRILRPKHTEEALAAQDYGTYIWQFYYDDKINQIRKSVPIIQNENKVLMEGYGACHECGYEGTSKDFQKTGAMMPQCPECESYRTTKMVDEQVGQVPRVVGVDEIVQGDVAGRLINFATCRYDPHVIPEESDHFMYSEYVPLRMVSSMLGNDIEVFPGNADDYGLQVMDALAARGGSAHNVGENVHYGRLSHLSNRVPMRTIWLKPERYMGFRLEKSEMTLAGKIPAGVPFEELFPKGICYSSFEEFRIIPQVSCEEFNISSGRYLVMSHSGIGKGVIDGADLSRDLNELHSMAMAGIKRYGASGLVIKANSGVTQENVRDMFKPQKAVFIDMEGAGGTDDIRKIVTQFQASPVNAAVPQQMIAMSNMLNIALMNGDFTQGLVQDVDIDTLGGQQMAHAKTEEQRGGILTGKVLQREGAAVIIYKLFKQHIKLPKWFAGDNERQGVTKGKSLSGYDMPASEVMFEAVPESEIPTNAYEKQVAARELVEKAGGIAGIAEAMVMNPPLLGWYTKQFGIDIPMLDEKELQLVCIARVDDIKELSNIFQDPEEILANLHKPLAVREQQNTLKAQFLSTILDDDEVIEWGPLVRATIELLIERHYEQQGEEEARNQIIMATAQMRAQLKMQEMQNAAMQPQIDQQRAMEQEDAAMQFGQELVGKMVDDEADQLKHERKMEEDEAADGRAAVRESDGDTRKLDIEREKAKMKPAPASTSKKGK